MAEQCTSYARMLLQNITDTLSQVKKTKNKTHNQIIAPAIHFVRCASKRVAVHPQRPLFGGVECEKPRVELHLNTNTTSACAPKVRIECLTRLFFAMHLISAPSFATVPRYVFIFYVVLIRQGLLCSGLVMSGFNQVGFLWEFFFFFNFVLKCLFQHWKKLCIFCEALQKQRYFIGGFFC